MLKRPHYIALTAVLLVVLVLLNLPGRTAKRFKLAAGGLFLPMFGLAGSFHVLMADASNSMTPRRALLDEIEQLRRTNSLFRAREAQVLEIRRENDRLREALRLQKQLPWKLQFARVVLRDPANWWRTIQIDAGLRNGVSNDTPVLTLDGTLVGKVVEVANGSSRVALVGDTHCGVSALVQGATERDAGVISSSASVLDPSLVNLSYVNKPTNIKLGQSVLTSGLGGVFPPGILVGHVIDTNDVGYGLYAEARVKLAADLSNLEEVWVVLR
jgi:rod shape-determining protein MreC